MGSAPSRTSRSKSGNIYRAETGKVDANGEESRVLVTEEATVEGLTQLRECQEFCHPSKHWTVRLLTIRNLEVLCCRWSPDDEVIAAGYFDGGIRLWDVRAGTLLHTEHLDDSEDQECLERGIRYRCPDPPPEFCITDMEWKRGCKGHARELLVTDSEGGAFVYKVPCEAGSAMSLSWNVKEAAEITACDWVYDGAQIAVGGRARCINIYDLETKRSVSSLSAMVADPSASLGERLHLAENVTGHRNRIFEIRAAHHDPNLLLSAAWDHCALLWDLRSATVVRCFTSEDLVMNGGEPADITQTGDMVVTASDIKAGDVSLWDVGGRGIVAKVPMPFSRPTSVQFSKDGMSSDIVAGVSGLGSCATLRRTEGRADEGWTLAATGWSPRRADVWSVDWAHRSKRICLGAADGSIAIMADR